MPEHPYQASVPASEQQSIQQSLFPAWHDRRHSHTTDMILEEGKRIRGSFDLLQGLVNEKQRQEDIKDEQDRQSPITVNKDTSKKVKSIVKDTTSVPSILNKKPSIRKDTSDKVNSIVKDTTSVPSIAVEEEQQQQQEKPKRRSRCVKFNDDSCKEDEFIKTTD